MGKIREMIDGLADECEAKGVPLLVAVGLDRVTVAEYAPEGTPELMKKARAVLFTSTARARRTMEVGG